MIYPENKASEFRCCGPEGCGSYPEPPEFTVPAEAPPPDPTKWTPGPIEYMHGDPVVITGPRFCIGAKCAAWEWHDAEIECEFKYTATESETRQPPSGDGWEADGTPVYIKSSNLWSTEWQRKNPERRGFCGLTRR